MRKSTLFSSYEAPFAATAWNILQLFLVYSLLRVEYLLVNLEYFRPAYEEGRILELLLAGPVFDTPGIMYTNALYVFLMLLPVHLKENLGYYRVCKWIYFIINSCAVLVNIADSVYFSYTLRRTTTEVFGEFYNENNLVKIVMDEMISNWYLVIFAVFLLWILWRCYASPKPNGRPLPSLLYYLFSTCGLIIAGITVVSGIRGGFLNHWYNYLLAIPFGYVAWRLYANNKVYNYSRGKIILAWILGAFCFTLLVTAPIGGWRHRDIRPIALSNANAYTSRPTETALILNTPFSIIRTIGSSEFSDPKYYLDKELLTSIYSPIHHPIDSVGHDRKNVVVIIIESFGREYIGSLSKEMLGESYVGYTPFTDSLVNNSVTFRYSFCNGRKSIDGMPSVLASVPMFIKPFILTPQSLNKVDGLPRHLEKMGYSTAFFHGARTGSMGFDGFARSIGFMQYMGREDFNNDKRFRGDKDFDGYWAIWDEPFLQYFALSMNNLKQPFMTALFTASSHHPFHIPDEYKARFPEEGLQIHKCIRYTDNALRQFFNTAEKQPWYDNTIFVITSDHTNMSDHPEYKTDLGGFCSPIIIFDPSRRLEPGMRNMVAQQIDIMPTILNLVGYNQPYVAFGKDLLNDKEGSVKIVKKDSLGCGESERPTGWAVNYLNGIYQYVRYGYVLQFDGSQTVGLFSLSDKLMRNNLKGKTSIQSEMEKELKAIIQSYMDRMRTDRLADPSI